MKKYLFVFFLIILFVSISSLFNHYLVSDLIFALDPDNYDVLEFVSWDNNLIYVFFVIASLLLLNFIFLKHYFDKFFVNPEIYQQTDFTNKFHIRSPPYSY